MPPWNEDPETADRIWRVVLATLAQGCDELWLRYGCLADAAHYLPDEQARRLVELIGPHWGSDDPVPASPELNGPAEGFLAELVSSLREPAERSSEGSSPEESAPGERPRYAEFGCAVVPVTTELIDLLTSLSPDSAEICPSMLSRLADHWHLRKGGRDILHTGDGMRALCLELTPEELEALRSALVASGISLDILEPGSQG